MSRPVRYAIAALAAAALVLAAWFALAFRPVTVSAVALERNVRVEVFGLGTVEARLLSQIGFEVGAALTELHADHGDEVRAGDVLARLHSAEQQARMDKAAAGVVSAEAAVERAAAVVGKARVLLAQKQTTNARRQALVQAHSISAESGEQAQMEADAAAADLAISERDLEVAKAALQNAQAQLSYDRVLLGHHTLTAPFDGIIAERRRELGSVMGPGEILFTIVDPASVWVLAYVDEARAGDIRVGQTAALRLRSHPARSFTGRVARIGIESDRVAEERRVYVACADCPREFHLGEQAEIIVLTGTIDEALLVPEAAIEDLRDGAGTVWTVAKGRLARQPVTLGRHTLDGRHEITAGLPEGARVVDVLTPSLKEGRAAKIIEGMK